MNLMKLRYEPSKEVKLRIEQLFISHELLVTSVKYLGKGEGSLLYKVDSSDQDFVLKTALFPRRKTKVLNEAIIRNRFINYGLNFIPKPCFTDQKYFPQGAVIFEFIEGSLCKFSKRTQLSQMAKILAQIHSLNTQIIEDGFAHILTQFTFLESTIEKIIENYSVHLNPDIEKALFLAKEEYKKDLYQNQKLFPYGLTSETHGDLSNNNIIDLKGKIWLIDWENAEYGDCIAEAFSFLNCYSFMDKEKNYFLKKYQSFFPMARNLDLMQIFPFYDKIGPVLDICWGIGQFSANLNHNLEPERKLRDLSNTALQWKSQFSKDTYALIMNGISQMQKKYSEI
jgi:thiamine kinase-like enzyme